MKRFIVKEVKAVEIPIQSPAHINAVAIRIMVDMGFRWSDIVACTPHYTKISAEALCELLCDREEQRNEAGHDIC